MGKTRNIFPFDFRVKNDLIWLDSPYYLYLSEWRQLNFKKMTTKYDYALYSKLYDFRRFQKQCMSHVDYFKLLFWSFYFVSVPIH